MKIDQALFWIKKIIPESLLSFFRPLYHFCLSFFAAFFYGFPSRRLFVVGVTGTKGKTTVVELIHAMLAVRGFRVASLSSLRFRIGEREERNMKKMTLPGRFFVQKFLHEARVARCTHAVLEVTSEGMKQFRHRFIDFDVVLMTNVSPEHIEAHGGFEPYLRAKLDLFWRMKRSGLAIINRDDPHADRFSAATGAHIMAYSKVGILMNDRMWKISNHTMNEQGISFDIGGTRISSKLLGEFNFYNILAASAFGISRHISLTHIADSIEGVTHIPGRMEFVQRIPFAAVIDYAHTPDSLRKVYQTLRGKSHDSSAMGKKLICVLGAAGGGRDTWKRPAFGRIAAQCCDEVVITNEDPYDENPAAILDEIEAGFGQFRNYEKILDRRKAIREALRRAKDGDTVIITGKGAEPWIMGKDGEKIPWNERVVIEEELKHVAPPL